MAEQKKKRGRPKKAQPDIDINEKKEQIKMDNKNIKNVSGSNDIVSIGDIQQKMKQIFGNVSYYNGGSLPTFANAINRTPYDIGGMLNNPFIQNQRLKNSNSEIALSDKETIQEMLKNPGQNEAGLRASSAALYYNNYVYQSLVKLNRDIPQYFNYVIPQNVTLEDMKTEKFKKEKMFVENFLEKFNIPFTFKTVSLQTAREGKCSYIFRSSQDVKKGVCDFAVLQKLPPAYVKYTAFGSESPVVVSYNFACFLNPQFDITQWPEWFQEIWNQLIETGVVNIDKNGKNGYQINPAVRSGKNLPGYTFEMINGSYFLYVELPQDLVYTFGTDFGDVFAMPDYAGLFADLSELEAYKILQSQTLVTNITNILTAEVPTEKDARAGSDAAVLSPEVILGLESDCSNSISSNILPFFAPLTNFKMHSVDHIPQAESIYLGAVRNVMSTAGTSGLINTNEKPSIAMIKGEQVLAESRSEYLTLQYTKFINTIINRYLKLDYKFKVVIWGGVYSYKDEVKVLKEMVQNGNYGMLPRLLSAYNTTIEEYKTQYDYIKSMGLFENNESSEIDKVIEDDVKTKTKSKKKNKGSTVKKPVGRPKLDSGDIENDNTAASVEGGENVSDNK